MQNKMKLKLLMIPVLAAMISCSRGPVTPDATSDVKPELWPDYTDVTFPPNMVAPTFEITSPQAEAYQVQIGAVGGDPELVVKAGEDGSVLIPADKWRKFAVDHAGGNIYFRVMARNEGRWTALADISNAIDTAAIDPYLAYRLIYPGYQLWRRVGIYQRDLTTYEQTPILENKDFDADCVNCHSFSANDPSTMMVHIRGGNGGTVIRRDGKVEKVVPSHPSLPDGATYPTWNRDHRHIAFSTNKVRQGFHTHGAKPIEVVDLSADIMVYDTETHTAYTAPQVSDTMHLETFPAWRPNSNEIYFCRSARGYEDYPSEDSIRYSLCRVPFDLDTHTFGEVEVVFDAESQGKSVSFPRFSPDGRWLMFTLSDYGNFSIWHPESALWLLDTADGTMRRLDEVTSDDVDSYHTWSSSGLWFVFSSKRLDGLCARPFFSRFDPTTGRCTKPLVLPQRYPRYYDDLSLSFNIPELITGPVTDAPQLLETVLGAVNKTDK